MNKCEGFSKKLGFLEGYYHPTFKKIKLVYDLCFLKIQECITLRMEFTLSNSFNLNSFKNVLNIDWNSLFNKFVISKKQLIGVDMKNSDYSIQKITYRKVDFNHLNCDSKDLIFKLDKMAL